MQVESTRDLVKDYYGSVLSSTDDLRSSACCTTEQMPEYIKSIVSEIEDDVLTKFYGCGSPIPLALHGATVLDLGCGTGRDVYIASKLVGPDGLVVGLDMTEEQLAVARDATVPQMRRFGFARANVDFRHGFIEDLKQAGVQDNTVDVVISNCVINLSPDKERVFREIFRVLKPGGEIYFADVFADRRIPEAVASNRVLYGECLGGALYAEDFRRLMAEVGFVDHREVSSVPISVDDTALAEVVGNVSFTSRTVRAFKLGSLEDRCEDYGQVAYYRGSIPHAPHAFQLDDHHLFERDRPVLVCGNTAAMLEETRFAPHFLVVGDRTSHFGLFDCVPAATTLDGETSGSCC